MVSVLTPGDIIAFLQPVKCLPAILVYEYSITFASEVDRFWYRRQSWPSLMCYLNRYLVLFGHIPIVFEYVWSTSNSDIQSKVCRSLQSYHQYLTTAVQVVIVVMLVMRIYALYERSRRVLALYLTVCTLMFTVGIWSMFGGTTQNWDEVLLPVGCSAPFTRDQATRLAATWGGLLVFDTLVFWMTLKKSLTAVRDPGVNLLTVLLRDGVIYFAYAFMLGSPFTRGVLATLTNVISSVMLSRLMLNIRDPALVQHLPKFRAPQDSDDYGSTPSTDAFGRIKIHS
ncbi:hypothetical protein BDN70DRAFT_983710 [Pholiota conissans]|uniref:DUF6533 domain-containing protein n=1 Tax=Pholiota conissans TaxID=109636 RepID=A0A9P6D198_9AGAR|nr:hypothetical protein BDN70DRAFT_983710 [Pholiota conissans]